MTGAGAVSETWHNPLPACSIIDIPPFISFRIYGDQKDGEKPSLLKQSSSREKVACV